jgi:hypothetical protein
VGHAHTAIIFLLEKNPKKLYHSKPTCSGSKRKLTLQANQELV